MINKLDSIIVQKQHEVAVLYDKIEHEPQHLIARVLAIDLIVPPVLDFKTALLTKELSVIAEIKRRSPSKGTLAEITDPLVLAQQYAAGGASALSILTDQQFFGGDLSDLTRVATKLSLPSLPILRKDFVIDRIQIAEAAVAGASAVLGIVAVLGNKLAEMLTFTRTIGLAMLVEVHDERELEVALDAGADIIGVNNRDLRNFSIDPLRALRLITAMPDHIVKVAESGITQPADARRYYHAGFNAVLIGEALVRAADPASFIKACCYD